MSRLVANLMFFSLLTCCYSLYALYQESSKSASGDGGVVRASVPAAVPRAKPLDASCCLIPPNQGLYRDRR